MNCTLSLCGRACSGLINHVDRFFFAPASTTPLALFRMGLALVLLFRAICLWGNLAEIFSSRGLIQWSVSDRYVFSGMPRLEWFTHLAAQWEIEELTCIYWLHNLWMVSLVALLVGWHTRTAAIASCFIGLIFHQSIPFTIYGVNYFLGIGLFYCVFFPMGNAWSLDRRAGRVSGEPSSAARLGLRLIQLHLCVVYATGTWSKAWGEQWWNGEAIWRSLMRTDLGVFDLSLYSWMADAPWVPRLLGWGTLLVEGGYVFFVWHRRTRTLWALATISLHLCIGIFMGLWSFAAIMIVFNASVFLVSAQPQTAAQRPDSRSIDLDREARLPTPRRNWIPASALQSQ